MIARVTWVNDRGRALLATLNDDLTWAADVAADQRLLNDLYSPFENEHVGPHHPIPGRDDVEAWAQRLRDMGLRQIHVEYAPLPVESADRVH